MHLVQAMRDLTLIADPYTITLVASRIAGHALYRDGGRRPPLLVPLGEGTWDEAQDLLLPQVVVPLGEVPDKSAKTLLDRFWNAFHFEGCPFFDASGRFVIPDR